MRSTTSFRLGGGASSENTAVAAVMLPQNGTASIPLHGARRLAHGSNPRALGDDRLERVRLGGGLEHQLAADREPDSADAIGIDVGPLAQERDRRLDVPVAVPADRVRIALAVALAAPVEQEHAVAVPDEHPGLPLRALAAGESDHGGAVLRWHVPALELQPVVGREGDLLEVGAQLGRRHDRAADVRLSVGGDEREDDHHRDEQTRDAEQRPAHVAAWHPLVEAPGSPQRDYAHPEQDQAGGDGEQPGVVVARGADLAGVVPGLGGGPQAEHAEQERHHGAPPRAQPRVGGRGEPQQGQRHQAAGQVVGRRRPRLGLDERVVHDVQGDQADCEQDERLLAPAAGVVPCGRRLAIG